MGAELLYEAFGALLYFNPPATEGSCCDKPPEVGLKLSLAVSSVYTFGYNVTCTMSSVVRWTRFSSATVGKVSLLRYCCLLRKQTHDLGSGR